MLFSGLKYKEPFSMDYRERGSHTRGVYPTQYTSSMGTARIKQEEEADMRIIVKEWNVGTKGKRPKQGLTNAKDLPMELPDGRESPYHRLD